MASQAIAYLSTILAAMFTNGILLTLALASSHHRAPDCTAPIAAALAFGVLALLTASDRTTIYLAFCIALGLVSAPLVLLPVIVLVDLR